MNVGHFKVIQRSYFLDISTVQVQSAYSFDVHIIICNIFELFLDTLYNCSVGVI